MVMRSALKVPRSRLEQSDIEHCLRQHEDCETPLAISDAGQTLDPDSQLRAAALVRLVRAYMDVRCHDRLVHDLNNHRHGLLLCSQ